MTEKLAADSGAERAARRIVTPEQLKEGWLEFVREGIPNVIHHKFKNAVKRRDGNWEVDEPALPAAPDEGGKRERSWYFDGRNSRRG